MPTIEEIRNKYPQYADVSDQALVDGLHKKHYSDLPRDEFYSKVGFEIEDESEFAKGLVRGSKQTASLFSEGVPALAKSLGNKVQEAFGFEGSFEPSVNLEQLSKELESAAAKYPAKVGSLKDIEGIGDIPAFVAGAAGESVPSLAGSMGSGFVGAMAAKQALKNTAKRAGKKLTDEQLNKALTKGALVGAAGFSAPLNTAETYTNLAMEGEDSPLASLAVGGLKTALDVITPSTLLGKMLGTREATEVISRNVLKRVAQEAGKTAIQEGLTEGGQEGLDILAETAILENKELFAPENLWRMADATIKGAVGGALAGGGTGVLTRPTEGYKKDPRNDSKFETEVEGIVETKLHPVSVSDSPVLTPVYLTPEVLQASKDLGVDVESYSQLGTVEIDQVQESLGKSASYVPAPFFPTTQADPMIVSDLVTRREDLDNKKDNDFIAGDGVMTAGTKVDPAPRKRPSRKVKTTNSKRAGQNISKKKKAPKVEAVEDTSVFDTSFDDKAIASAKNQNEHSREKLVYMTPDEFLSMAEQRKKPSPVKTKTVEGVLTKGEKFSSIPTLSFTNNGDGTTKVTDHEGRHRADALKKRGVKKIPVILKSSEGGKGTAIRWGKHKGALPKSLLSQTNGVATIPFPVADVNTQKDLNLPQYGDLHSDVEVPMAIQGTLQGITLKQEALPQIQNLSDAAKRIVAEVTGGKANLTFFDSLFDGTDPVRGAQFAQTVVLALKDTFTPTQVGETAYHEAFHFLWENNFFSDAEKAAMLKSLPQIKDYIDQDGYLSSIDYDNLISTEQGKHEVLANAFGKIAIAKRLNTHNEPFAFKSTFNKFRRFLNKLANAIRGLGFNSLEDIFQSAIEGRTAENIVQEAVALNAEARYQRLGEAMERKLVQENEDSFKKMANDARFAQNKMSDVDRKQMGFFGRYLQSIVASASENPFAGVVYNSVRRRLDNSAKLLNKYLNTLGDFGSQERDIRYRIHELADKLNISGQKAYLDQDGFLNYEEDGVKKRLKDKVISRQYIQLQTAYREVLFDWAEEFTRKATEKFKKNLPENPTLQNFRDLRDQTDKTESPKTYESLTNYIEAMEGVEAMSKVDYTPHMRFGAFGIVVKDKAGETVAFYGVERGKFRNLYDEKQLSEVMEEVKAKYSDASRYDIFGDGKINDLNAKKFTPFTMTRDTMKNYIDTRFLNLESLVSLLHSQGVDKEAYATLKNDLFEDILAKGFKKRFLRDRAVDGYSHDWDRVSHAYLTGASHFLSGLSFKEELAVLQAENAKLKDEKLQAKLAGFLEYTGSPQEDFQNLRTVNFLWTMGGNLSTAMLQAVTLPTTTLATMTQYNPNLFQNMKYIGKWTGLAHKFFMNNEKSLILHDGTMAVNFAEEQKLNDLIKKGVLTTDQATFLRKITNYGKFQNTVTEESLGAKGFDPLTFGIHLLGAPISLMEQTTRFATTMAAFDALKSNPQMTKNLEALLKDDYRFQAQLQMNKDMTFEENAALFMMDESHAVFGKLGRVEYQKGLSGALFFPFMTYPHQMLELAVRMYGRGPQGKRALGLLLGSLFLLGGLVGLPGGELLKELLEALENQLTGTEEDFDLLIRQKIYEATGDARFAKAVTQGVGRGYFGLDISKRIGLPVPGQELLLNVLGIRGESPAIFGVQGSMITGIAGAWGEMTSGGSPASIASSLLPVAPGNLIKAVNMKSEGVTTKSGKQIVTPEEVKNSSVLARALGITSDQIATGREKVYYQQLAQQKYKVGLDRFRKEGKDLATKLDRAYQNGDSEKAKELTEEYEAMSLELEAFVEKHDFYFDFGAFHKSVAKEGAARATGETDFKKIQKHAREEVEKINDLLGVK